MYIFTSFTIFFAVTLLGAHSQCKDNQFFFFGGLSDPGNVVVPGKKFTVTKKEVAVALGYKGELICRNPTDGLSYEVPTIVETENNEVGVGGSLLEVPCEHVDEFVSTYTEELGREVKSISVTTWDDNQQKLVGEPVKVNVLLPIKAKCPYDSHPKILKLTVKRVHCIEESAKIPPLYQLYSKEFPRKKNLRDPDNILDPFNCSV